MARSQPYQSLTYAWAAQKTFPVDLSFLNAARDLSAPIIEELVIWFQAVITTSTGGMLGGALPTAFSQILVQDMVGERINLRGSSLRVVDQMEYGAGYQDVATIAASASNVTRNLFLRIPFMPIRCRRRRDYGLSLREFVDGGKMQLVTSAALLPGSGATGGTIQSGNITLFAHIRDEGTKEAKSRLTFTDESINQVNFDYNVNGFLRALIWYNGEINEAASTPWASQTILSKTLEYQTLQDLLFQDWYVRESQPPRSDPGSVAAASVFKQTDVALTGQAVPLLFPYRDQKIPDMPKMQTVNIRTSLGSITTTDLPQVIKSIITERAASATARTLGRSDVGAAVAKSGRIKGANGNKVGIKSVPMDVAKVMPIKLSGQATS